MAEKVKCEICGALTHTIEGHLIKEHPEMKIGEYKARFPDAQLLSEYAKEMIRKRQEQLKSQIKLNDGQEFFHEVFGFDSTNNDAFSAKGNPIPIQVLNRAVTHENPTTDEQKVENESAIMIPEINNDYVFDTLELKRVMSGVEMNIPVYVWGHKGAGKTELVEQICARTNRPLMRVQHTVNTEESQIVGQWVVRNGQTEFELGPLPLAMIRGWAYLADEYDFAMPNVLSTYQAVLEGKPLTIKEAPIEMRIIRPHKDFRFFATGNTNGSGDETGLYQGTTLQNSANYDRFGVVIHKSYMTMDDEIEILRKNTKLSAKDAQDLVRFAHAVREAFDSGKISDTISPRTLLFAAKLGVVHASFQTGLELSFFNKLNAVDNKVCQEFAQRIFGV